MFTYYNLRRKKLSFSYAIPFNFTRDNDYYTGDSEYNLLKRRDYVLVRFLNGGDDYDCLQTIDLKIGNQHSLRQQLDNVNKFLMIPLNVMTPISWQTLQETNSASTHSNF